MREVLDFSYSCPVQLEQMPLTQNGRACSKCNKEVVDFTHYSVSEIKAYRERNGSTCGIYRADHVNPNFIAPITIGPKIRKTAFFASLLLVFSGKTSLAQSTNDPKKEQSNGASNAPTTTPNGSPISMSIGDKSQEDPLETEPKVKSKKDIRLEKKQHKKWYRTRKFPYARRSVDYSGF